MPFKAIEQILNRKIGLDVASIGAPAVARAVQSRMSTNQEGQLDAYLDQLNKSPAELQALVETVVVHETWFYRHPEAFTAVAALATKEWLTNSTKPPMRLLSAPCSTGEEPYSLAMTLIDAGLPPERFLIDGIDISAQALKWAGEGGYGKNSFRGADLGFRARHFSPISEGFRINEAPRASVRFRQANLLAFEGPGASDSYDVVLCRNLLIYFDRGTQLRAIEILRRLLSTDGLIFVGPGEANLMLGAGFVSGQIPLAFAFREAPPATAQVKSTIQQRRIVPLAKPFAASPQRRTVRRVSEKAASNPPAAKRLDFDEIRKLADQGHLTAAAKACEEHLRTEKPSVEAWRLLGLLRDAGGDVSAAADCYRKALYLDPHDRESLEHLALLLERQGDTVGAQRVSARALRLEPKGGP